jgi:hypothetical protein
MKSFVLLNKTNLFLSSASFTNDCCFDTEYIVSGPCYTQFLDKAAFITDLGQARKLAKKLDLVIKECYLDLKDEQI